MKSVISRVTWGALLGGMMVSASALACDPELDGCLGCNDDEFPICLQALSMQVCAAAGLVEGCDMDRIYDDAERNATISTGSHMARITSMMRSARKYRLHGR